MRWAVESQDEESNVRPRRPPRLLGASQMAPAMGLQSLRRMQIHRMSQPRDANFRLARKLGRGARFRSGLFLMPLLGFALSLTHACAGRVHVHARRPKLVLGQRSPVQPGSRTLRQSGGGTVPHRVRCT